MATNDVLIFEGGHPVNAMDVNIGDDDSPNGFYEALDLHGGDKRVKVVLMNCFGGHVSMEGIMRMAFKAFDRGLVKPVVFRI
jgi:succinyl-CoA synthetase beta subunit